MEIEFPFECTVSYFPPSRKSHKEMVMDLDSWSDKKQNQMISEKYQNLGVLSRETEISMHPDRIEIKMKFKTEEAYHNYSSEFSNNVGVNRDKRDHLGYTTRITLKKLFA